MNIFKLRYDNEHQGIDDLKLKGVYIETEEGLSYGQGVQAIVNIGKIILTDGTFDEQGNLLTEPTYIDGYHFDIMTEKEIDFGGKEIFPNSPKHVFAGIN